MKEALIRYLEEELGARVIDCGAFSTNPVDYPDIAEAVARRVAEGKATRGIAIDGAGIGSCMAANRIAGARAAVCHDDRSAKNSREHNDANVLCLGAGLVPVGQARRIVRIWLSEPFGGGRHQKRVDKITRLEGRESNDA
ncbi:MAG: ribose 5-phosphate isomerase B [Gemmatimonadetes bacterium]|nr:ribose 5-phosphate isomerase B [Gemmatimonadota bacterium]